jgi:hypothetical protein
MERERHAMVTRNELESHLAALLQVERFEDYGPNGLQVEHRFVEIHNPA